VPRGGLVEANHPGLQNRGLQVRVLPPLLACTGRVVTNSSGGYLVVVRATCWIALVATVSLVGLGSVAHATTTRKIPRGVEVHWMNKSHTHGWATTPYQPGPDRYSLKNRKRLCGLAKYGTNTSATRVCETFDAGAHWRMAFTNHPRRGDDAPIYRNFYFDVIGAFWRVHGVRYVSGTYYNCNWTMRTVDQGYKWVNWALVEGSDTCGGGKTRARAVDPARLSDIG
jgi:hypothetical protein